MIKVIKNGLVITMDSKRKRKYEQLDVVVEDHRIKELTTNYTKHADLVIDAANKVVLPGLINAHTHLGMSIFRAVNDCLTLTDWLEKKIWPIEQKLTKEDIYYSTLLSCIEMIKTGTTMSNDMYIQYESCLKAVKDSKVRVLAGYNLMDFDGKGEEKIRRFKGLYDDYRNHSLIHFSVAPHSLYTCSKDYLKKCSDLALDLKLPCHIHFCENKNEVENIKNDYQKDPVDALEEVGLLRNHLILAHCTFISDYGLNKLQNYAVSFVHNPVSNLNLGCGIADITKYKNYVNVCLGTDGQGSGNNMNLFYHMSIVDFLQKGLHQDSTVYSSYEILKMATINGAKALGMEEDLGSIEVGKYADIIILDMSNIEVYPTTDLITNVCHNMESNNVDTTMINGEILMQNHQLLLDISEEILKEKINDICNRLIK